MIVATIFSIPILSTLSLFFSQETAMNRFLIVAMILTLVETKPAAAADYAILLHGLGRTPLSMKRIEWTLQKQNYRVINVRYPSTRVSIQDAADHWLDDILKTHVTDSSAPIHFVAHSLGGIILRQYLTNHEIPNLGRVVMLAPPNHGSELADRLKNNCLYRLATGPAGQQLGTGESSIPRQLGPVEFELGVIAGDRSLNPLFSSWIPGSDDGKVSVRSAKMPGADFLLVHHSHTWMAWSARVNRDIAQFLRTGNFRVPPSA
jgi:triacylglycerol lipase